MNYLKRDKGFTLIEVLAVIIIISVLTAIAISKFASSTVSARQKADVATAHQVKAALDRFQIENGAYPKNSEFTAASGTVTCAKLIPKYISKLEKTTTQQVVAGKEGFGVASLKADETIPDISTVPPTNIIMIYLTSTGLAAEVRAYDETLENVLWTSAN